MGANLIVVLEGDPLVWVEHNEFYLDIICPAQPLRLVA